ncbi:hypothetical protein, partial [Streptomyces sp. NPDC056227]|uniref:hypothetical protein n=1 Tax=Streptomyces sp. NPDC056227 TaxID=3345753 RepID=UPI0035E02BAF
ATKPSSSAQHQFQKLPTTNSHSCSGHKTSDNTHHAVPTGNQPTSTIAKNVSARTAAMPSLEPLTTTS